MLPFRNVDQTLLTQEAFIGIDQTNIDERSHQVGFMDLIYSNARSVHVCIQDSLPASFSPDYHRLFHWLISSGSRRYADVDTSLSVDLQHLLSLRYFDRAWVIQEVALARVVYLHVNDHVHPLKSIPMRRLEYLCQKENFKLPPVLGWSGYQKTEAGIIASLRAGMRSKATDVRDRVYAVLSLLEPQARSLIPVDYSLGINLVYAHVVVAIIVVCRKLDILSYATIASRPGEHQSLNGRRGSSLRICDLQAFLEMPTVTSSTRTAPLSLPRFEGPYTAPWRADVDVKVCMPSEYKDTSEHRDKSCVIRTPSASLSGLLPRFHVRAHYLDRLLERDIVLPVQSRRHPREIDWEMDANGEMKSFDRDIHRLDGPSNIRRISHALFEKFARYFKVKEGTPRDTDSFLLSLGYDVRRFVVSSTCLTVDDIERKHPHVAAADMLEFFEACETLQEGHPAFFSHFSVGIASFDRRDSGILQPGDEIFAIDGARTPFILRNTGDFSYRVVSECYLWAAMELDCWNPGTKKGKWGENVERPTATQTRMIEIH